MALVLSIMSDIISFYQIKSYQIILDQMIVTD